MFIVLCLLITPALAAAQDFLVSKGRDGLNYIPRAAVNSSRGDVLVVWRGAIEGDGAKFEIYSALVKFRSNGKAKARKARKVGRDEHLYFYFDVAYDPVANRYLVIWNGGDSDEIVDSIYGQFFGANGKPDGDPFKILPGGSFSPLYPVIAAVPANAKAPEGARFLAAYTWNSGNIGDASGSGLRCIYLDGNGSTIGSPIEIFDSVLNTDNKPSVFINERLIPTLEGKFLLTTGHEINSGLVIDEPMIFQLFTFGNNQHISHALDTDNNRFVSAVQLNKQRILVFWRNGTQDNYYFQINPKDFSPRSNISLTRDIGFLENSQLVKLQDDRGALHFVYRTTSIRVFYINKKGLTQFPGIRDIELGRTMDFAVFAVPLPDSNRTLLLHSLSANSGNSELYGYVYELEELP